VPLSQDSAGTGRDKGTVVAMTITETPAREAGRPRVFTDEDVFQATCRVVRSLGYDKLTIASVASQVGCTGPALIRRFGSKHQLLRAYLHWSTLRSSERFLRIRAEPISPLARLRARFTMPESERPEEIGETAGHTAFLAFYLEGRADPLFRPYIDEHARQYEIEIAGLIDDAVAADELLPCDSAQLAHALLAAIAGASLMWSPDHPRTLNEETTRVLDALLFSACRP
jgi:AcrR family transcriptional regulator